MEDPAWVATGVSLFDYLEEKIDDEHDGRWHQIVAITLLNYYGLLLLCVEVERHILVQVALEGYPSFLSLYWRSTSADGPDLALTTDPEEETDWAWVPLEALDALDAERSAPGIVGDGFDVAEEAPRLCLSAFDLRALVLPYITQVADPTRMIVFLKH